MHSTSYNRARLNSTADRITRDVMDLWSQHAQNNTTQCVTHGQAALPTLAALNRPYKDGVPLLRWLADAAREGGYNAGYAARALGEMGEKAAADRVLDALVEMVREGGNNARNAADVLGKWYKKDLRVFELPGLSNRGRHIKRLACGERAGPVLTFWVTLRWFLGAAKKWIV